MVFAIVKLHDPWSRSDMAGSERCTISPERVSQKRDALFETSV